MAHGAEMYIEELDKTYLESLKKVQAVIANMYPDFSLSKISVQKVVQNRFCNENYGLLFSGGIDCITSYIKHRSKKPELIYVWGIDVRSYDIESWKKTSKILTNFADREGVSLNVIRTNIYEIIDKDFMRKKFGLDWWQNVSFGVVLSGLCAPLTCVADIKLLIIASSATPEFKLPLGSYPLIKNGISWGDIQVFLDSREFSRQLKLRYFLKDFTENDYYPFLKVCNKLTEPASNCGVCEKCCRTIVGLAIEGIDPSKCGFKNLNERTFEKIRERFCNNDLLSRKILVETRGDFINRIADAFLWEDIHQHIPKMINHNVSGSKEFLEWFRMFNLSRYLQQTNENVKMSLPHILLNYAKRFLDLMPRNIRIVANQLLNSLAFHYEKIRWK